MFYYFYYYLLYSCLYVEKIIILFYLNCIQTPCKMLSFLLVYIIFTTDWISYENQMCNNRRKKFVFLYLSFDRFKNQNVFVTKSSYVIFIAIRQ